MCTKVDTAHQSSKSKEVYATIRQITKKPSIKMQTVKSKDGKILTEGYDVKRRWKENYQELYNNRNPVDDTANNLPQMANQDKEAEILREEVESAVKKLTDGKTPGYDSISGEELKAAGETGISILHKLCNQIWDSETFPKDWGRAIITPIYKKKDKLDCGNYRGISLLSHVGKIFALIIQRRISKKTEEILSESQAGFRPGRSTIDQLFTLRQIIEKYLATNQSLFCCYIDFEKAFDSVWQEGLWKAMQFFNYPAKYIRLLQALYDKSESAVRVNGELTDWFRTTVGVRQGCVLSPQLFNILLEVVMLYATHDSSIGVLINGLLINNLRFADDIVLIAESENDLQTLVNAAQQVSSSFGLKINIAKTEVQVISKRSQEINININGKPLQQVDKFVYLGGTISQSGSCSDDVQHRIGKALRAIQQLNKIWSSKDISIPTKMELYKVLVLSILMYGAETWSLKKVDESRLLTFEMTCLRKILRVTRLDKIRNTTIRESLGAQETVIDKITTKRLRYFGHINRMKPTRYPAIALNGNIHGQRPRGRPLKTWLDCVKVDIQSRKLKSITDAHRRSSDRRDWQTILKQKPSRITS